MNNELVDIIQLINTENIGPITFYKLLDQYGSAKEAINNLPSKFKIFPRSKAALEVDLASSKGIKIISYIDKEYPKSLLDLEDAPPILYTKGNIDLLNYPIKISVVGARNASINGRKAISKLSYDLTNNDILVVSGMARGVDSAAHKGSMYAKEQLGPTIAVLGTGVDVVYPNENKQLYEQICSQGLVISEFPIGTEPQPANFPRRNRIVAGLSLATLVGEASVNSGSLITARLSLEQGKDIFAIPGNPQDSRSNGPNKLIKEGAILVENVDDIMNIISITNNQQIKKLNTYKQENLFFNHLDKEEKNVNSREIVEVKKLDNSSIIDHITIDGVYVDELIRELESDVATISMELLNLELSGKIERKPGNKVALVTGKSSK